MKIQKPAAGNARRKYDREIFSIVQNGQVIYELIFKSKRLGGVIVQASYDLLPLTSAG
jgi:hypothetical protein